MGTFNKAVRNEMLDAFARNVAYQNAAVYVKLHKADPGEAGTNEPAAEATRKQATFGSAASEGAISNTAAIEWTSVSTTETVTHVSLWTAATEGTCLGTDQLSAPAALTEGDTLRIAVGELDLTIT